MGKRIFDEATSDEIVRLYLTGITQKELAHRYRCSQGVISNIARSRGVGIGKGNGRRPALARRRGSEVVALWNRGLSAQEIYRETGLVPPTIKGILAKLGIAYEQRPRRGSNHPDWNGGRYVNDHGYVEAMDDDPRFASMRGSDGYTPEHRLVMARSLGRPLKRHESVHHINGDRADNRLENLELRNGKHGNGVRFVCLDCGSHNVQAVELRTLSQLIAVPATSDGALIKFGSTS